MKKWLIEKIREEVASALLWTADRLIDMAFEICIPGRLMTREEKAEEIQRKWGRTA